MTSRDRRMLVSLAAFRSNRWYGTRETSVMPNTAACLVARGWLEYAPVAMCDEARRLLYRLTPAGQAALDEAIA